MSKIDPQTPEPQEHDETKTKREEREEREVEWSFDFAQLGDSLRNMMASLAGEEEVHTTEIIEAVGEARSADADIRFSVGTGTLRALPGISPNLIEATLVHVGDLEYDLYGEEVKRLVLRQRMNREPLNTIRQGMRALADRKDLAWHVALTPTIPLRLDIDGGVGPITADLTGLRLTSLDIDSGVGTMHITLPAQQESYRVELDGGVGQTTLNIPADSDVSIDVDGGVGSLDVTVAPNSAVQITSNGGLGSVNVPQDFVRTSGKSEFMDNSGVWQTEGFDLAQRRVIIRYDGGVGSLRVRYPDVV